MQSQMRKKLLKAILYGVLLLSSAATMSDEFKRYQLNIESQNVEQALRKLANATDSQLLFPYDLVKALDLRSTSISGQYTLEGALEVILKGTPLSGELTKEGVILITLTEKKSDNGEMRMNTKKGFLAAMMGVLFGTSQVSGVVADVDHEEISKTQGALEEIVITATKKGKGENIQDVSIAVTAFGESQIEKMHLRSIEGLTFKTPNVSLDGVGTIKGMANFSIRGLDVSASIPSIDPTVGVIVDGVYSSSISGVLFDQFDLAGIEILRGPQGLLFGRNVTGGAVVVNTKNPTDEPEGYLKVATESGPNTYYMGSFSGPLIEDKLLGKLALYRNDDRGYFKNRLTDNNHYGASETTMFRAALTFLPAEGVDLTIKFEHGSSDGDGPASQNRALWEEDTHYISGDDSGYFDTEWDSFVAKYTMDLGLGQLVSITGWRESELFSLTDIDGIVGVGFHYPSSIGSEQFSEELRYNFTLGEQLEATIGAYYFSGDLTYIEHRLIAGGVVDLIGGGHQDQKIAAVFSNFDWRLNEAWVLNAGIRYTKEEKDVVVADINAIKNCSVEEIRCWDHEFSDVDDWSNVMYKVGAQWFVKEDFQVYATAGNGFRSGGYNMRNVAPGARPGPVDPEKMISFEFGVKAELFDGKLRLNAAAFRTNNEDIQRAVFVTDPVAGTVQLITNTADVTIDGFEVELSAILPSNFSLDVNLGIMDNDFDKIHYDLTGDGVVDSLDYALDLTRFVPKTYGVGLTWQHDIFENSNLSIGVNHQRKEKSPASDDNTTFLSAVDIINANVTLSTLNEALKISLFGRNLKDEVYSGSNAPLPKSPIFGYNGGGTPTFTPLMKGRVFGVDVSYMF